MVTAERGPDPLACAVRLAAYRTKITRHRAVKATNEIERACAALALVRGKPEAVVRSAAASCVAENWVAFGARDLEGWFLWFDKALPRDFEPPLRLIEGGGETSRRRRRVRLRAIDGGAASHLRALLAALEMELGLDG